MDSQNKIVSAFDKTLLVGLGCGVLVLCGIIAWFAYIVQNLPIPSTESTQTAVTHLPPQTPNSPILEFSSPLPPPTETLSPASIPNFNDSPPTGKIVFACYIKQIDQICLMNADGSGREQLTDFDATAFYPSLSPDGQTIYFSSKRSGGFEIYSIGINGDGLQRLTRDIGSLYAPELSPSGELIVFADRKSTRLNSSH